MDPKKSYVLKISPKTLEFHLNAIKSITKISFIFPNTYKNHKDAYLWHDYIYLGVHSNSIDIYYDYFMSDSDVYLESVLDLIDVIKEG